HVGDAADARARDVGGREDRLPLARRPGGEEPADLGDQLGLVRMPVDHGPEPGIAEPRLLAEGPAETLPELRQLDVDIDVAVARRVDAGDAVPEEIADLARRLQALGPEEASRLHGQDPVEERGLDVLARPRLPTPDEREQDPRGREAARVVVD